jgi:hypothetical protein
VLNAAFRHEAGKMFKGSVIAAFGICRKTACRQLPAVQVILQTIAADALSWTWLITAIAIFHIIRLFTFHGATLK